MTKLDRDHVEVLAERVALEVAGEDRAAVRNWCERMLQIRLTEEIVIHA